jgi:hypothetical protein
MKQRPTTEIDRRVLWMNILEAMIYHASIGRTEILPPPNPLLHTISHEDMKDLMSACNTIGGLVKKYT